MTIVVSVRKARVTVTLNGKKVSEVKGPSTRLNLIRDDALPNTNTLAVGGFGGKYTVSYMALMTVTGRGKKLR